jgi:hypothetical protein
VIANAPGALHSAARWYLIVPLGGRFWIGMVATIVGIGIAAAILFALVGAALVTWGVLGALIVFGGIALGIAWLSDRRRQAQYDQS